MGEAIVALLVVFVGLPWLLGWLLGVTGRASTEPRCDCHEWTRWVGVEGDVYYRKGARKR